MAGKIMVGGREFLVTTTSTLDGYQVEEYLGVVTSRAVGGTDVFSDFAASLRDIFGGRSLSYQKRIDEVEDAAMTELVDDAVKRGANAVIGLHIDHGDISGKNKAMFMVTMCGTAVRIRSTR